MASSSPSPSSSASPHPHMQRLAEQHEIVRLFDAIDTFIFDCDGVLWRGQEIIPGVKLLFELLGHAGKKVFIVTNNSTRSRQTYLQKFENFDIHLKKEQILCSSFAAAAYLHKHGLKGKAYVVGEKGICDELDEHDIPHTEFSGHAVNDFTNDGELVRMEIDDEVRTVIVGFDRRFNYKKLAHAQRYAMDPRVTFIATNTDSSFPHSAGLLPGAGAFIKAIEECSGRSAIVVGKPNRFLIDCIENICPFNRERTLMVGDRLNTDIIFGSDAGVATLLVETGIHSASDAEQAEVKPNYLMENVAMIYHAVKALRPEACNA